jgi:hypothetical protein
MPTHAESLPFLFSLSSPPPRLYRQHFTREECDRLDSISPDSALSEISLLRILISRLLSAARRVKMTIERHAAMLSAFCQTAGTLASLARFEFKQQGSPPSLLDLLYPPGTEDEPL